MSVENKMLPMEITTSRLFAASRDLLFDAFADPEKLKHWWGPDGFSNTMHEFDFSEGGTWRFTMHAPGGHGDFENTSTFKEIRRPEKIVFIHHLPVHVFTMTMTFADDPAGTRLDWHMLFEPAAENESLKGFIKAANEQNFDRLEAFLELQRGRAQ